jgi:hypothetical protein
LTGNGTAWAFYVDGVKTNTFTATPNLFTCGAEATWIGSGQYGEFFNGRIDEAAVYTSALSLEQVISHYTAAGYGAPAPIVTGITGGPGTVGGGASVTISGSAFTGATAVTFGGVGASSFSVSNDSTITAVSPAHAAGTVDVVVTTPSGTSSISPFDQFVFGAESCSDVVSEGLGSVNGDYTIHTAAGQSYTVYCNGMPNTPTEYLDLVDTGVPTVPPFGNALTDFTFLDGANYSAIARLAYADHLVTAYTKIRLLPATLQVDTSDNTFSTTTGTPDNIDVPPISYVLYGSVEGCNSVVPAVGFSSVDLRGTPFQVSDTMIVDAGGSQTALVKQRDILD